MDKKEKIKRKKDNNNVLKTILRVLLCVLAAIVLIVLGYLLYVRIVWHRIDDNVTLTPESNVKAVSKVLDTDQTYKIMTYNVGFGAYSEDFDFFMDGGKGSWAFSEDAVKTNLDAACAKVTAENPDFVFIQELDIKATRSYGINELEYVNDLFYDYHYTFALNYDKSPFFAVPLNKPHGTITAGLATYSKFNIESGLRRSLPIMMTFSRYFDLDRCYSVTKIPTSDGKYLCLYNVHLSAYGSDDSVREGQTSMLFNDMKAEYDKGNYCICGGDFNHNLMEAEGAVPYSTWAYPFPRSAVPEHLMLAMDTLTSEEKAALLSTVRDCDEPYTKGHTKEFVVDGFIISDNISVEVYKNLYDGFKNTDHEPVYMEFKFVK